MELEACAADQNCACLVECFAGGGGGFDCGVQCDGVQPVASTLFMCRGLSCGDVC